MFTISKQIARFWYSKRKRQTQIQPTTYASHVQILKWQLATLTCNWTRSTCPIHRFTTDDNCTKICYISTIVDLTRYIPATSAKHNYNRRVRYVRFVTANQLEWFLSGIAVDCKCHQSDIRYQISNHTRTISGLHFKRHI